MPRFMMCWLVDKSTQYAQLPKQWLWSLHGSCCWFSDDDRIRASSIGMNESSSTTQGPGLLRNDPFVNAVTVCWLVSSSASESSSLARWICWGVQYFSASILFLCMLITFLTKRHVPLHWGLNCIWWNCFWIWPGCPVTQTQTQNFYLKYIHTFDTIIQFFFNFCYIPWSRDSH